VHRCGQTAARGGRRAGDPAAHLIDLHEHPIGGIAPDLITRRVRAAPEQGHAGPAQAEQVAVETVPHPIDLTLALA
jgi:hypothetical protein